MAKNNYLKTIATNSPIAAVAVCGCNVNRNGGNSLLKFIFILIMDKKSILEGYANSKEISRALRELGKAHRDSLLKLPPEPVSKQVHWHNVTIKAIKTELKPMDIDEVKMAPELIQKLYFCYLSNTPVGTDLLIEANENHPTYFVY